MGISYREIESNSVGYKEDYEMHSMDFEEFLWAKGYQEGQIADLYRHMLELEPFSRLELETMLENFREYMVLGGDACNRQFLCEKQELQRHPEDAEADSAGL